MSGYNIIFFWYSYVIRVTILEMNGIVARDDWSANSLPVLSRSQGTAQSRREREEGASQQTVPSFVVAFSGDQVTISSKRSDTSLQGDQLPARMPVSEAGVAGLPDVNPAAAAAGMSLSSETIQSTRSFGPYDVQINRYAMKRYSEASSFRGSQTSTFEITA